MNENTTLSTTYVVNKTNQFVTLSLLIGAVGQTGTSTVLLNGVTLLDAGEGDVFNLQIGKNSDLNGKLLEITSTISDTASNTNHTELIIRVKGGVVFREYPLSQEVSEGGSALYYSRITFFGF